MTKLVLAIYDFLNRRRWRNVAEPLHFYHGDHLGSAAYLTDRDGHVVQTLAYLPYGEDWVEQNGLGDTSRLGMYRYNGKERDGESGYLYYGARYYWSELWNGWLSVDPMVDKYPGVSPYAYCVWNPVKLVDPDGMKPRFPIKGTIIYTMKASAGIGLCAAFSASQSSGIAYDQYGVTHFLSQITTRYIINQNMETSYDPSIFLGADIGIGVNVIYVRSANRFVDAIERNPVSLNSPITISFGDGTWGLGGNLSFGYSAENGKINIQKSISVSYNEAKHLQKITDVITPPWMVNDIESNKNGNGKIIGFRGTIYTKDASGRLINTGVKVKCGIDINKNKIIPNNMWISDEYNK